MKLWFDPEHEVSRRSLHSCQLYIPLAESDSEVVCFLQLGPCQPQSPPVKILKESIGGLEGVNGNSKFIVMREVLCWCWETVR